MCECVCVCVSQTYRGRYLALVLDRNLVQMRDLVPDVLRQLALRSRAALVRTCDHQVVREYEPELLAFLLLHLRRHDGRRAGGSLQEAVDRTRHTVELGTEGGCVCPRLSRTRLPALRHVADGGGGGGCACASLVSVVGCERGVCVCGVERVWGRNLGDGKGRETVKDDVLSREGGRKMGGGGISVLWLLC